MHVHPRASAAVFTILGGVFYVFGSFLGAAVFGSLFGLASAFGGLSTPGRGFSLANAGAAAISILVFGIFAAILIIIGGALLNSDDGSRRKAGGILAIVMMILGAVPDVGGFLIGFIFVLMGSVLGLTYKEMSPDLTIGVAQTPTLYGPQSLQTLVGGSTGQFCIKCGKQLYEEAQFCKFCGSPVPR
jgi:zinc-ribbon domain